MKDFRNELLQDLLRQSGEFIDIKPLIEKYCGQGDTFDSDDKTKINCRLSINAVLVELVKMGWINLSDTGITSSHFLNHSINKRQFHASPPLRARLTTLGELEFKKSNREEQTQSINVGGNFTGNLNTGTFSGDQSSLLDHLPMHHPKKEPTAPQQNIIKRSLVWLINNPMITTIIGGLTVLIIWAILSKNFHVV